MKKVAIITGYTCNNNCRFCYDANKRKQNIRDLTTFGVKEKLIEARKRGCDYVDFLGGEFTIRHDALELVKFAKRLGFETISITTNGRMFSYKKIAKKFIDAGVNSIIFSVHGHNAKLHDFQTRVLGSFEQLMEGIKNIKELGLPLFTNTTITRLNYKEFPKIAEFLVELGIVNAEFVFVDPTGNAFDDFYEIVPKISEAAPYIRRGLDVGIKNNIRHWHIRYVPLCYFQGYEDYISELQPAFEKEEHYGPEFTNLDVDNSRKAIARVKALQCVNCDYVNKCEGVWKVYAEKYGLDELKPIKVQEGLPEEVKVELTQRCNLDCKFCFNKIHQRKKELSTEEVKKVINNIVNSGIKAVRFTGGEPFLRKDLKVILKYAKSKGLYVILNTNGTFIDEKNIKILNCIDDILVSFHNITNSSEKSKLFRKIKKSNPDIFLRACTIAIRENIQNLEKFYAFFDKQEIDDWFLLRPVPVPENREPITHRDVKELVEKILSLNKKYKVKTHIANTLPFCSYEPERVSQVCVGGRNDDGHTRIVVDTKGITKPSYFIDKKLGNALKDSILDCWNSEYMKNVRKLKLVPEQCKECRYAEKCRGGCRFAAKLANGTYDSLDPLAQPEKYKRDLAYP